MPPKSREQHKHLPQAGDADGGDCRRRCDDRRRIRHADAASQSDRAVRDDLRVDRRPAHRLRAKPVRLRAEERRRAAARHRSGKSPHVVSHYVGGAFGSKGVMTPRTAMIALAAKRLNRPVKLVATRAQGFTIATYRAETRHHIRLGAQPRRQARRLQPRRLGDQFAARSLRRRRRRGQRAALRLWRRRHQGQHRPRRPQHAGLHALAAGRALHLRAGKRDGRNGDKARHGPGRVPPHQRHR